MSGGRNQVMRHIGEMGLIAVLHSDFAVEQVLEIGDAFLASPLLVMGVAMQSRDAAAAVAELRRRHGEHLLVGATGVTLASLAPAIDAGAQFVLLADADAHLVHAAQRTGLLAIPTIGSAEELRVVAHSGARLVNVTVQTEADAGTALAYLRHAAEDAPGLLVDGAFSPVEVGCYAAAGALGVVIGSARVPAFAWSSRTLIERARRLRRAWNENRPPA